MGSYGFFGKFCSLWLKVSRNRQFIELNKCDYARAFLTLAELTLAIGHFSENESRVAFFRTIGLLV